MKSVECGHRFRQRMAADGSKNTRKGSEKLMAVLCKRQWMAVRTQGKAVKS